MLLILIVASMVSGLIIGFLFGQSTHRIRRAIEELGAERATLRARSSVLAPIVDVRSPQRDPMRSSGAHAPAIFPN